MCGLLLTLRNYMGISRPISNAQLENNVKRLLDIVFIVYLLFIDYNVNGVGVDGCT